MASSLQQHYSNVTGEEPYLITRPLVDDADSADMAVAATLADPELFSLTPADGETFVCRELQLFIGYIGLPLLQNFFNVAAPLAEGLIIPKLSAESGDVEPRTVRRLSDLFIESRSYIYTDMASAGGVGAHVFTFTFDITEIPGALVVGDGGIDSYTVSVQDDVSTLHTLRADVIGHYLRSV